MCVCGGHEDACIDVCVEEGMRMHVLLCVCGGGGHEEACVGVCVEVGRDMPV